MRYRTAKERRYGAPEIALLPFLADPSRISIDVGANVGLYSWLLKRVSRAVYAFEPNPKMFRFLRRIAGRRIKALPIALSDRSGSATLRVPRTRRGFSNLRASLSPTTFDDEFMGIEVAARRLDELEIHDVGFIKIDVEGFEQAVLAGARETIARDRPTMLIEIEEQHTKRPVVDSIAEVEALGYRAMFMREGVLRPAAAFDAERNRLALRGSGASYVNNFVFLPTSDPA
ncbi:MAG: FkbM family methyltransferase [Planctomycetota bacterium]|nr:FkbM family methyltransferase [Planctomycetota bacterium]